MEDVLWHPWLTGQEDVISESVTGVEDNSEDSSPGLAWKRGSSEHPMQGIARLLKKLKGEMH